MQQPPNQGPGLLLHFTLVLLLFEKLTRVLLLLTDALDVSCIVIPPACGGGDEEDDDDDDND